MKTLTNAKEKMEDLLIEHQSNSRKKVWIKRGIIAVLVLIICVSFWLSGFGYAKKRAEAEINRLNEVVENPVVIDAVTPEVVLKILNQHTENIQELASAEYLFTNAARFTDAKHIKNWKVPMTQKSFVQKWDGVIKAGIKLDNLSVSVTHQAITITLPPAEILSYSIDTNSVEVLDEKNNVFNPISIDDKVKFDQTTEQEMKKRAVEHGLLTKARKNAENTIAELLTAAIPYAEKYTIEFKTTEN